MSQAAQRVGALATVSSTHLHRPPASLSARFVRPVGPDAKPGAPPCRPSQSHPPAELLRQLKASAARKTIVFCNTVRVRR